MQRKATYKFSKIFEKYLRNLTFYDNNHHEKLKLKFSVV